jgi:hypothetical protein
MMNGFVQVERWASPLKILSGITIKIRNRQMIIEIKKENKCVQIKEMYK